MREYQSLDKKILFIADRMNIGGLQRSIINIQNEMKESFDVDIFIAADEGAWSNKVYNFIRIPLKGRNPYYFLKSYWIILNFIKKNDIKVVHFHTRFSSLMIPLLRKYFFGEDVSFFSTVHSFFDYKPFSFWPDNVIVLSKEMKNHMKSVFNWSPKSCRVISHGIKINKIPKPKFGTKRVIFVGRLSAVKNPLLLIRAFSKVVKNISNSKLIVIGDGSCRERMEEMADKLMISDNVKFVGFSSNVDQLIYSSDFLVLPSKQEGQPLALLEAGRQAKPVIVSDIESFKSMVDDGANGYICKQNPASLSNKMIKLLDDSQLCAKMGLNNYYKVKNCFKLKTEVKKYLDYYISVV